jgi:hypothetical protein
VKPKYLRAEVNKAFKSGGGTTQTQPKVVRNKQKGLSGLSAKRLFQEAIVYLKNDPRGDAANLLF